MLEEARMIVPGIQALFGFQLIAVYNATFHERLDRTHQVVHLVSICWIALAMGLVMTPAAYHRQAERGWITPRLARIASRLLQAALACLALGAGLDVYLIGFLVLGNTTAAVAIAVGVVVMLGLMWFAFPRFMEWRHPLPRDRAAGH